MREPLLLPVVAFAAGLLAQRRLGWEPGELALAAFSLIVLGVAALLIRSRRIAAVASLAAIALAAALRDASQPRGALPELEAAPREVLTFTGCVVEPLELSADRASFVLELEPGARARVTLYELAGQPLSDLRYGRRVEFDGRARPVRNFRNPGGFDYAGYMARRQIYWTVTVARRSPIRLLPGECGSSWRRALYDLRSAAAGRIRRLFGPRPQAAALLEAMLIGSEGGLERAWAEVWRRTGTYHALVVSGVQITVLAVVFLFLLRVCLVPEAAALALTTVAAWLYAFAAGGDAPVVRAAAGFTLFVAGRMLYRRLRLINLLAAVALAFLALDPAQLFEPSFQLSFLAVAAIGALALPLLERSSGPLAQALRGLEDRGRDPTLPPQVARWRVELRLLAETVALWAGCSQRRALPLVAWPLRGAVFLYELAVVSLAVQIGLALPMICYFHRLSVTGLTANIVIGPLASAAVPVGFAAVATGWAPLVLAARWLAETAERTVEWHAAWEPDWRIADPPLALSAALVGALLWAAFWARRPGRRWLLPVAVVATLLALLAAYPFAPAVQPGALEVAMLDVGQAESLFVAFPDGRFMLVDGAGTPDWGARTRLDPGEDVISPYLWHRGIRRLDVVVATHGHSDHIGGLPSIVANFRPRELWYGAMPDTAAWRKVREQAARSGTALRCVRAGVRYRFGGAQVEVLAPDAGYEPGEEPHNNDSLVLALEYGRYRFLLPGDIEKQAEAALLARGAAPRADVLKVAHHGGRNSTTGPWLEATRPALALISVGFQNAYNLPHPTLLERLAARRILALRTDRCGLIAVRTQGRHLELSTEGWDY